DLQNQLSVPALIQQLVRGQTANWQTTKNKRARRETEVLIALVALQADEFDAFDSPQLLFRDTGAPLNFGNGAIEILELFRVRTERRQFGHAIRAATPTCPVLEGTSGFYLREKKQNRLVTTFTALSRRNSQIAETPLMQMNRINAVNAYVLY